MTTPPAAITVDAADSTATRLKTKVKAFVDAYNALITTARTCSTRSTSSTRRRSSDVAAGVLFGDIGLNSMLSGMRTGCATRSSADRDQRAGRHRHRRPRPPRRRVDRDAKEGKLAIDDTKLCAALDADWTKVSAFLDKFSGKVDALVKAQTGSRAA